MNTLKSKALLASLFLILLAALSVPQPLMAGGAFAPLSRPEGSYEFLWQMEGYRDLYPPKSDPIEVNLRFITAAVSVNPSVDLFFHLGGGNLVHGNYGYGSYVNGSYSYSSPTESEDNHLIGAGITKTLKRWKTEGSVFNSQSLIGAQVMGILPNEAQWSEVDLFVALKRRAVDPKRIWFHSITIGGSGTYVDAELSPSVSRTKNAIDYSEFQNALFVQLGLLRFLGVEVRLSWDHPFPKNDEAFSFVLAWPPPNGQGSPGAGNADSAKGSPQAQESESARPLPSPESVESQQ